MKTLRLRTAALSALLFLGAGSASAARLVLAPESVLWLSGDSTLHVYHSTATELRASGEMGVLKPFPAGPLSRFELVVPVKGLKSGKAALDRNMAKALKADENPDIVFRLLRFTAAPGPDGNFLFKAEGTLSVAGRGQSVSLEGSIREKGGMLRAEGEHALRMTDFGVKPPVMMLGTLKTDDVVTIHYRIIMAVEADRQGGNQ